MVIFSSSPSTSGPNFLLPIILIVICCSRCVAYPADRPSNDHYLGHTCSSSTFDSNSDYSHALSLLVNDLINNASPGTSVMRSWPQGSNKHVFGMAMCRGDSTHRDCTDCVTDAGTQAREIDCPINRSALVWRDYCELKYSDVNFYGDIDNDNKLIVSNHKWWDKDNRAQEAGDALLRSLSESLSLKAVNKSYASGMAPGETDIYDMAQCTEDLTKHLCRACLSAAMSELIRCCRPFSGARVVYGSCNVRRETYPFLRYK